MVILFWLFFSPAALAESPVNDEPATATLLPLSPTCTPLSGTTVEATPSSQPAANGEQEGGGPRADVFYTFIAPCSRISLRISAVKSTTLRTAVGHITLYRFTAGGYTPELTNGSPVNSVLNATTLIPGQRYYLRVQTVVYVGFSSIYGSPATFSLCAMVPPTVFAPAVAYPHSFVTKVWDDLDVGDWNGDGYPDIVTLHPANSKMQLLLNQRNGTFSLGQELYSAWRYMDAAAVGDLDKDGRADIAVLGRDRESASPTGAVLEGVEVQFNKASGSSPRVRGAIGSPRDIALSDVNNDGFLDLIATNYFPRDLSFSPPCGITVLLNKGNGTFAAPVLYALANPQTQYADKIITSDMNGDGFKDIVTIVITGSSGVGIDKIGILLNRGDGTFAPIQHSGPGTNSSYGSLAVGDVNGDTTPDLVVVNRYSPQGIIVFLNQGQGTFAPGKSVYARRSDLNKVVLADLNGDGALDMLAAASNARVILLFNNQDGTFGKGGDFLEESYLTTPNQASGVASDIIAVDINLDGKVDIVANNIGEGEIGILLNQGPCTPSSVTSSTASAQQESASLAPNPATGSTSVYLPASVGAQPATVTLCDGLGRVVRTSQVTRAQPQLALGGVLPGVYLVHVQAGQHTFTRRLVVH